MWYGIYSSSHANKRDVRDISLICMPWGYGMGWKERDPEIKAFYQSQVWKQVREAYVKAAFGICENCGAHGEIVHHRHPITTDNVHDVSITIDFQNLELLCRRCHRLRHTKLNCVCENLAFGEDGSLIQIAPRGASMLSSLRETVEGPFDKNTGRSIEGVGNAGRR